MRLSDTILVCVTRKPWSAGPSSGEEGGEPRNARSGCSARRGILAFTMIEIALCLAIIGFALVAIIGVLPTGLGVQKENRQETIINQEAAVWMDAIRNGAQGYDDLTNYVISITNYWTTYDLDTNVLNVGTDGYTRTDSGVTSVGGVPPVFALTNGQTIVGLLSMPKRIPAAGNPPYQSNYVVAYVRAMSGAAVEKFPQTNQAILEDAFIYRMIVETAPYVLFDVAATNYLAYPAGSSESNVCWRTWQFVKSLQTNSYDTRLTFRWPLLPNGNMGNGRQTYRAMTGSWLMRTNDYYEPNQPLYFFRPSTYVQAQ